MLLKQTARIALCGGASPSGMRRSILNNINAQQTRARSK